MSENVRQELAQGTDKDTRPDYRRTTVLDLAPYWIAHELQKILGERALRATREGDVDEMRRLTEGVEWLKRRVYVRDNAIEPKHV